MTQTVAPFSGRSNDAGELSTLANLNNHSKCHAHMPGVALAEACGSRIERPIHESRVSAALHRTLISIGINSTNLDG